MQTSIRKSGPDSPNSYVLTIGDSEITLDGQTLKKLLVEITTILMPQENIGARPEDEARKLAAIVKTTSDIEVQKLLQTAEQEDILVLIKSVEDDADFQKKIYGNMSKKARTMFAEDAEFKYGALLSKTEIKNAVGRLKLVLEDLKKTPETKKAQT